MRSNLTVGLTFSVLVLVGCGERVVFETQRNSAPDTTNKATEQIPTTGSNAPIPPPVQASVVQAPAVPRPVVNPPVTHTPPVVTTPPVVNTYVAPATPAAPAVPTTTNDGPPMVQSSYNCVRPLSNGRSGVATALVYSNNDVSFWNSSDCSGFAGSTASIVQPALQGDGFNPVNSTVSCTFRANGKIISFTLNYGDPDFWNDWEEEVNQLPDCP